MWGTSMMSLLYFLHILIIIKLIRCDGTLYTRVPEFDNKYKAGIETLIHNASSQGPCAVYAMSSGSRSFFYNELTYECQLVFGVHDDVTEAVSEPGNSYYVNLVEDNEVVGGCTPSDLSNGFISNPATGLCFKVFGTSTNWGSAEILCNNQGYQLIVLDNLPKAKFVSDFVQADAELTEDGYWIGLSAETGWVDDSPLTATYWGNTDETLDNGMCVRLDRNLVYKWKDDHCNSSRAYICQTVDSNT